MLTCTMECGQQRSNMRTVARLFQEERLPLAFISGAVIKETRDSRREDRIIYQLRVPVSFGKKRHKNCHT